MASQIRRFRSSRSSSTAALKLGNLLVPSFAIAAALPSLIERTDLVTFVATSILSLQRTSVGLIITAVTLRPCPGPSPSTNLPSLPYLGPFLIACLQLDRHQELALVMVPVLFDLAGQVLVELVALEKPPDAELLVLHSYLNQSVLNLITCTI